MQFVLASGSPRRKELLSQLSIEYVVDPADIKEVVTSNIPAEVVMELSRQKAVAVSNKHQGEIVLAADTVVAVDESILGKPADEADAFDMLKKLSGRSHFVYTGVTIISASGEINTFYEATEVEMFENTDDQIRSYIATGEPLDKAGSYGIQGKGAILVKGIKGDYNNVVGLPLAKVARILNEMD